MSKNSIESRRQNHFKLSSKIAQLNDEQLQALFDNSESSSGWGKNHVMVLGESKVFVKRIPMTNIEYDNLFSTKNLYDLPTYYNYGVGSAGFGVFRELIAHIKTTNWVLAGEIATFPLLYHYRIVPASGPRSAVDMEAHQSHVEYWGNSTNIGNYILARAKADYELVLFLEYIPYVLETWLQENPKKLQQPLSDLLTTIDFLRTKEIIHFDAHFHNILTDGERAYLTDFGLVLDRSFALTKTEESFFMDNVLYDYGEVLWSIGNLVRSVYENCAESNRFRLMEKYGILEGWQPGELRATLLDNIEQIHADKILDLDEFYVASIIKYRSIIMLMQSFFSDIRGNQKKDTKFLHAKLQLLLEGAGLL
jgi:hypothetical protein